MKKKNMNFCEAKTMHPFYSMVGVLSPLELDFRLDFIVFALFTYYLHWNFNLYKYLMEQGQK